MAEKTPLPTHAQLKKLLEMLLLPNEEMDEMSGAIILDQEGIDRSKLADDLRMRLERKVQEQRGRGDEVSPDLLEVIARLEQPALPDLGR
jgi:hypothetical protein